MLKIKFMVFAAMAASILMMAGPADAASKAEKALKQCKACHSFKPGKKKAGPSLASIVGRKCGSHKGYKYGKGYKKACKKTGFVIDEAFLMDYLKNPSKKLSALLGKKARSKMSYKVKKEKTRKGVIALLKAM